VRLYAAALDGASPPADSADEARLRRALDALAEVLDAKRDEADAFAEAAEKRKQPAAPEAELTEAEKIALGRSVSQLRSFDVFSSLHSDESRLLCASLGGSRMG
jgi:hypothetical protein